jgi:tetratricopeptide (TPR) repeat protein/O-antigen ligase
MNQSAAPSRRLERRLVPLLAALYLAAMLPYASVHPGPRLALGLACVLVGGWTAWVGLRTRDPSWVGSLAVLLLVLALGLNATALIPLDAAARTALQPVVATPVNAVLALVGQERHPLALEPRRALLALQLSLGVGLVGLAAMAVVRNLRRARRVAWVLVGTGVLGTALAALHWATEAGSIYWVSGVPAYARDPFFAPFVNPNQGGAACATLLPLALALMLRQSLPHRLMALGAAAVLLMGIAASGSRGAVLEGGVALVVFGLLLGSRTVQVLVGLALAGGIGVIIQAGPVDVAHHFSTWISPDWFEGDLLLGRGGIWFATTRLVGGAPLLGTGAGSYEDAYQVVKSMPEFTTTSHAHQDYLQALAEQGVLGGSLWIGLALLPVLVGTWGCVHLHRGRRRSLLAGYVAALAALLVSAAVTFSAHIGALAVLYALLSGVAIARGSRELPALGGTVGRVLAVGQRGLVPLLVLSGLSLSAWAWLAGRQPASPWAPAEDAVALGRAAYERAKEAPEDLDAIIEAEDWYRSALARRPVDPGTLFELARTRWLAGDPDDAGRVLEISTQAYPTLIWSWLNLARLRRAQREDALAREAYAKLLSLDLPSGQSAEPYLREAALTGEDLREVFADVLPPRADRLRDAAGLASRLGELALAEELYQRAVALEPEGTVAYASYLVRQFRYEEALALVEGREGCMADRTAGTALLALERYEDALVRYRSAQNGCGSDDPSIRAGIARARLGMGDAAGLAVLEQLLVENPEAHGVRRTLIIALRQRGDFGAMREQLEALLLAGVATDGELRTLRALQGGRGPGYVRHPEPADPTL